jgi:hypothetical protein
MCSFIVCGKEEITKKEEPLAGGIGCGCGCTCHPSFLPRQRLRLCVLLPRVSAILAVQVTKQNIFTNKSIYFIFELPVSYLPLLFSRPNCSTPTHSIHTPATNLNSEHLQTSFNFTTPLEPRGNSGSSVITACGSENALRLCLSTNDVAS